jgi:ribosomal protein S18 acetylase RimI-like enzyme
MATKASCVFSFPRPKLNSLPEVVGQKITRDYYEPFKLLHSKLFPGSYYTGTQLITKLGEKNTVYIETENQTLLGFIRGKLEEDTQEGYIDFVGVRESVRQQGIGKKLVTAIIHWIFNSFPQTETITLTVYEDNLPAVKLYRTLGFQQIQLLQGYRKNLEKK